MVNSGLVQIGLWAHLEIFLKVTFQLGRGYPGDILKRLKAQWLRKVLPNVKHHFGEAIKYGALAFWNIRLP